MAKSKFVIYDQFHWQHPDHLVELVPGWDEALARYNHWATSLGRNRISRTSVSARDLVRDLKKGTRPTLSANQLRNDHHMRFVFDLNYRISSNLASRR